MIFRTAFAYAFSKTRRQRRFSALIICGVAIGMAALIIAIGVMDNLQSSIINRLRDTESFDIVAKSPSLSVQAYGKIEGVDLAFEFLDVPALALNESSGRSALARLRGVDEALAAHRRFRSAVSAPEPLERFSFGNILSAKLGLGFGGGEAKLTFLKKGTAARVVPFSMTVHPGLGFSSTNGAFASSTALVGLKRLLDLTGFEKKEIGVYVKDGARVSKVAAALRALDPQAEIQTFREANSTLCSALALEKGMVVLLLLFIIVIVGFYLKRATGRLIASRRKEAAALRALGLTRAKVVWIFLLQALQISVLGIVLGTAAGLAGARLLPQALRLADKLLALAGLPSGVLSAYPFRASVAPGEVCLFAVLVLVCSGLFALAGARRAFRLDIMEILKDDTN